MKKQRLHYTIPYVVNPESNLLTIMVIGCGGTGSRLILNLARMDLALRSIGRPGLNIMIVDNDRISESNIGRQLYFDGDIGEYKANVMSRRINRSFGMSTISYVGKITKSSRIKACNIIFSCVDSASSRIGIHEYARKKASLSTVKTDKEPMETCYYWIDTGNTKNTGQIILGTPGKNVPKQPDSSNFETVNVLPTVIDEYPDLMDFDTENEQGPSCSLAEALNEQDLFINTIIADLACDMLWKMIKDMRTIHRGIHVNLSNYSITPIKV